MSLLTVNMLLYLILQNTTDIYTDFLILRLLNTVIKACTMLVFDPQVPSESIDARNYRIIGRYKYKSASSNYHDELDYIHVFVTLILPRRFHVYADSDVFKGLARYISLLRYK